MGKSLDILIQNLTILVKAQDQNLEISWSATFDLLLDFKVEQLGHENFWTIDLNSSLENLDSSI